MYIGRQIVVLMALAALAGGGYTLYQDHVNRAADTGGGRSPSRPRTTTVETALAETRTLVERVEAVGTTRALQSVDIVPLAEGRLVELNIEPGAEVGEGAVLARLDSEIEESTLEEAEALLTERDSRLARSNTLMRSNASTVSTATLEQVRSERAVAAAAVNRARRRFEDRTVRAPFSGVLGIRRVDLGARVDTSTVLATLDDLSKVEIEFSLPETVYGQIHEGQRVAATSAAFADRTFTGTVVAVDSRVDSASRAFRVRARVPNADRALPVGMFMRLDLELADRQGIVVPEEALAVEGGEPFVFVVVDGKADRRPVETGLRRNGLIEIVDGIAAGDEVVTRGIQSVRDGAGVTVLKTVGPQTSPQSKAPALPATEQAATETPQAAGPLTDTGGATTAPTRGRSRS